MILFEEPPREIDYIYSELGIVSIVGFYPTVRHVPLI